MGELVVRCVRLATSSVPMALVLLVWGVFVPAARGAPAEVTPTSMGSTSTTAEWSPVTSTTYVTIPVTVTTIERFPFVAPAEDAFPPSTMSPEPEKVLDKDGDVGSPRPVDRDPLPVGGPGPGAPSAPPAAADLTGPSTTLAPDPGTSLTNVALPSASDVASPARPAAQVGASEAAFDKTAANRLPSLFWPGALAVGCLLLLSGPAAARRLRHALRHDVA